MRTNRLFISIPIAIALILATAAPRHAEATKIGVSVTFADDVALEKYRAYVTYLASDPARFERDIATLARLEHSDVIYVIRIADTFESGIEGSLTTDGERIFVNVSNRGGVRQAASLNSRLAHELEHARQFDAGEIAFSRDAKTKHWTPVYSSYDIGDEVKAWEAQLRLASPRDFWFSADKVGEGTLLQIFAEAGTPERRADVLLRNGYTDRNPVVDSDVVFPASTGFKAGQVVRPDGDRTFFGRVNRVSRRDLA